MTTKIKQEQPTDAQIEKVARAISRAYIQGFRYAHPGCNWSETVEESVNFQWEMVCREALEALV